MYGAPRAEYHGGMEANPVTPTTGTEPDDRLIAEARRQEIRALATIDCLDLADESVMAKAWRSWPLDAEATALPSQECPVVRSVTLDCSIREDDRS